MEKMLPLKANEVSSKRPDFKQKLFYNFISKHFYRICVFIYIYIYFKKIVDNVFLQE